MGFRAPLMTLRDVVMFPGAESRIYVGRDATMAAVRRAKVGNGEIAVFTQRAGEQNEVAGEADVYAMGTLCRIEATVEMKDRTMQLLLVGEKRIALTSLGREDDGGLVAECVPAARGIWAGGSAAPLAAATREALVSSLAAWAPTLDDGGENPDWRDLRAATELADALRCARSLAAGLQIKPPGAAWTAGSPDPLTAQLLNAAVAHRQRILEADEAPLQLALLHAALAFDLGARALLA